MIKIILVAATISLLMSCESKPYTISKSEAEVDQLQTCIQGEPDFQILLKIRIYFDLYQAGYIDQNVYTMASVDLGELHKFRCLKKFLQDPEGRISLFGESAVAEYY